MSRLFYNRNSTLNRLFRFFECYFSDATLPTMENLFLLVVSMLALDCFHSVRFAWIHIISRFTNKSLNSFYYTLEHGRFDCHRWLLVTARHALCAIPHQLREWSVFLSIDDTMVEKYGLKFQAASRLFDHAAHNGSNYLNGHCFVSLMLHVPVWNAAGKAMYLSIPLGYRMWIKDKNVSKLELAARMIRNVMPAFDASKQVILLCDSWYPKGEIPGLTQEFPNLEIICNARIDTALYDLPPARTGKRGRPRKRGERLGLDSISMARPEGADYFMGKRQVITNLWKDQPVYAFVTATSLEDQSSFRLFLCTVAPEDIRFEPEKQSEEKIRRYSRWGMLPLGLYLLRWNIETSYYETKKFWSFSDYMVRSIRGIENLSNLVCISYASARLLPYYEKYFEEYRGMSSQEVRFQLGEKIRMNLIVAGLEQMIENVKNNGPIKEALKNYARMNGYS